MQSICCVQITLMLIPHQFSLSSICVQVPGAYWWYDCKHSTFPPSLLVKSFVWFADSLAGRSTLYCLSVLLLLFNTCLKKVSLLMVLSDRASCSSEHYQTVEKLVSEVQKKKKNLLKVACISFQHECCCLQHEFSSFYYNQPVYFCI